ncbi:hypothetical protein SDC9_190163 [bioreactor metagenome]|uniref:Uncharacterized protein n=1 Tax=bioreactor metagenome TaxID=1076179 RepID=A0A645HVK6_9ZZZZ
MEHGGGSVYQNGPADRVAQTEHAVAALQKRDKSEGTHDVPGGGRKRAVPQPATEGQLLCPKVQDAASRGEYRAPQPDRKPPRPAPRRRSGKLRPAGSRSGDDLQGGGGPAFLVGVEGGDQRHGVPAVLLLKVPALEVPPVFLPAETLIQDPPPPGPPARDCQSAGPGSRTGSRGRGSPSSFHPGSR